MTSPALRDAMEALEPFAKLADEQGWEGAPDLQAATVSNPNQKYADNLLFVSYFRRAAKAYESLRANSSDVSVPREAFKAFVGCWVSELPDRNSPEDEPDMMLVSCKELDTALDMAFEALSASPQAKSE